ncbi:precorrin-3B synthase [Kushneria pakistanensis]|uniref:Precorrin-3B synthase n=2 Tax=Kushneria pakistanensis TaxID=1508770 RepID=A0ABQ3FJ99_9GAMM|nr:precorrin-3B synthase [Kushneria pakistanensis]
METGDGWLARLPPLITPLEGDDVITLCEAAERFGNGLIEVTRRGNLQLRGLAEGAHRELADYLTRRLSRHWLESGVPAVSIDPLMDVDEAIDAPTRLLARRLRSQILTGAPSRLAPKCAVVIDAGGWAGLAGLTGDIHLRLDGDRGGWIGVAGNHGSATWLGWMVASKLSSAVLGLLSEIDMLGPRARGQHLLAHVSIYTLCDVLGCRPGAPPPRSGLYRGPDAGARRQRDVLDVVWPFGQMQALALLRFTREALRCGALAFAAAPGRHWRILCREHADIEAIIRAARQAGLIVADDDARLAIMACTGAPGCASALMVTHDTARTLSTDWSRWFDDSVRLHLSGCAKGCASLDVCTFTLVGMARGIGLVFQGNPRGVPRLIADDTAALGAAFEHLAHTLAREGHALPLEAGILARVGEERIVALLRVGSGHGAGG